MSTTASSPKAAGVVTGWVVAGIREGTLGRPAQFDNAGVAKAANPAITTLREIIVSAFPRRKPT
jgi:hypothetical protein